MYDVQTILSAYDKQGTLVQWLKNLDETLKTSGLESVNTTPVEGGYKLQFKFANGVVLESDLIHLDADILSDINRALKTPLANPSATELVAVDTNGAQTMLEIGQGLKVEAGILEAEATGGGNYVLELTGESGTLTDEQYQAVVDNFPNVSILYQGTLIDIIKTSITTSGTFLFALTILSGNIISTTSWSIASDKSWTATLDQVTIPTSSGGITKTKVTLAELQSMLTEENVGAIVEIIPKQIVSADETMQYFVASGLLPIECVISRTQSGYSTLKSNSFFTYKDETTYTINQLSIGLYKDLAGNTIFALYRVITVANGNVTNETTDMVEYVSDDNFDFYIYR